MIGRWMDFYIYIASFISARQMDLQNETQIQSLVFIQLMNGGRKIILREMEITSTHTPGGISQFMGRMQFNAAHTQNFRFRRY